MAPDQQSSGIAQLWQSNNSTTTTALSKEPFICYVTIVLFTTFLLMLSVLLYIFRHLRENYFDLKSSEIAQNSDTNLSTTNSEIIQSELVPIFDTFPYPQF